MTGFETLTVWCVVQAIWVLILILLAAVVISMAMLGVVYGVAWLIGRAVNRDTEEITMWVINVALVGVLILATLGIALDICRVEPEATELELAVEESTGFTLEQKEELLQLVREAEARK